MARRPRTFSYLPQEQLDLLWEQYHREPTRELHGKLIEAYRPLVERVTCVLIKKIPPEFSRDEIFSAGLIGLMQAVVKFDPSKRARFTTFAERRVRGSIQDELRCIDYVPRKCRERSRIVERAAGYLRSQLGREPTRDEIRARLGVDEHNFKMIERDARVLTKQSMHETRYDDGKSSEVNEREYALPDPKAEDPAAVAERFDFASFVVRNLPPRDAIIIHFYFFEGRTMREIAGTFDKSESRVSQWIGKTLDRLRAQMREAA